MKNQTLIEAKDLQIGDLFKLSKAKRIWHKATDIIVLDREDLPKEEREKSYRKNRLLILEGCKQLTIDKNREVIRYNVTLN